MVPAEDTFTNTGKNGSGLTQPCPQILKFFSWISLWGHWKIVRGMCVCNRKWVALRIHWQISSSLCFWWINSFSDFKQFYVHDLQLEFMNHDPNQVAFYPQLLPPGPGRGNGTYQSTPTNVRASPSGTSLHFLRLSLRQTTTTEFPRSPTSET